MSSTDANGSPILILSRDEAAIVRDLVTDMGSVASPEEKALGVKVLRFLQEPPNRTELPRPGDVSQAPRGVM